MNVLATRLAEIVECPYCGRDFNSAISIEGHSPKPGDISVCLYCAGILVFTETLGYRKMEDGELENLPEEYSDVKETIEKYVYSVLSCCEITEVKS